MFEHATTVLAVVAAVGLIFGLGFFVYLMIFRSRRINNIHMQRLLWIAEKEARKQQRQQHAQSASARNL